MKPATHIDLLEAAKMLTTSIPYQLLIIMIFIDLVTGYSKAYKTKSFDSKIGTMGMLKHLNVLIVQTVVGIYTRVLGFDYISQGLAIYFVSVYGLSILENLEAIGVPFPEQFKEYFNQMRNKKINIPATDITIKTNNLNAIPEIQVSEEEKKENIEDSTTETK